jgi:hypothetical protein
MADIKSITAKLGNMRAEVEWTVYPPSKDGRITIQSDHRIALFRNDGSNKGLLSKHKAGGAYFAHLSPACGAEVVDVPQEVVDAAVAAQPKDGDTMGNGVITIMVSA